MKNPRTSARFNAVFAVFFLLSIPAAFADTVNQGENTVSLSQSYEWNSLIGGLEYLARHPEVKLPFPDRTAGEGSATGVKEAAIVSHNSNAFITHFKEGILNSITILYAHGYYTSYQARQLSYTVKNADVTGADVITVLEIIGKLGAAN